MEPESLAARTELTRLVVCCPHDPIANPNPIECPLHEVRVRTLKGRLVWARKVDPAVMARVLEYHDFCLARRKVLEVAAEAPKTEAPMEEPVLR